MRVIFYNLAQKFIYLKNLSKIEKKNILSINTDDKLEIKISDVVKETINKEFPQYNDFYIVDVLKGTSMNIEKAYLFLRDPIRNVKLLFNESDDHIILNMKGSNEYKELEKEKGIDRVREREDFLKG